jgi:hypothetical protein
MKWFFNIEQTLQLVNEQAVLARKFCWEENNLSSFNLN